MKYIIYLLVFFHFSNLHAQNYQISWSRCYGGSGHDEVRSIIPYNKGYLFFGNTMSHDGNVMNNPLIGSPVGWLVGLDSVGNIEFDKYYTGFGTHLFGYEIVKIDSGYYLFGNSGPDNYNTNNGYWFAKTSLDFNIIWQKIFGGTCDDSPKSCVVTENGGIVGLGCTLSTDGDIDVNFGFWDNWLVSLNRNGDEDWIKTYGCYAVDEPFKIISTVDNNYMFCTTSFNVDSGNVYCSGHDFLEEEAKLIKIDTNGELLWTQCYGGSYVDVIFDIKEVEDGYICVGGSKSNDIDLQGHHGIPGVDMDLWILKTDEFGELQWSKLYGGSDWDDAHKVFKNATGGYTVFGYTKSQDGDVVGNTTIQRTFILWILKIDSNGELIYQKPFIELENLNIDMDVLKVSDFKYLVATTKISHGCNHTYPNINSDIYVFEIQDMDEFIPAQPFGADIVCLANTSKSYYSTQLVVDTMETQWLLIPGEAGIISQMHDSVFIHWNTNFADTAWLQVRAVNVYGESSYSVAKEIIVYAPLNFSTIMGPDSVCTANNQLSFFSTQVIDDFDINWYLEPENAGYINNQQDTAIISWNATFEGVVSLKTSGINQCDGSEYSEIKEVSVKTCTGLVEHYKKELKIHPNPTQTHLTFEMPPITAETALKITDIFGKTIVELLLIKGQTQLVWNCSTVTSGVYFYQTEISGVVYRGKIVVN
jgi:hypothetical protein